MSRSYKRRYDTNRPYKIYFKRSHFQDAKAAYLYIDKSSTGALANEYIRWHKWFFYLDVTYWLTHNLDPVSNYYYTYESFKPCDVEQDYQDRTRHTSLQYPHYTSEWDDLINSASKDKWCQHLKPRYCCKKVKCK